MNTEASMTTPMPPDEPRTADSRRMLVEKSLGAALKSHPEQFHLALQPIVDAGSGAVLSWESLLRWNHPSLGHIPPMEFIPFAERSGLIEAVGDLVLDTTLQHLVEFPPSVEPGGRDASLSVNVSPLQLTRAGFGGEIAAVLDAWDIDHSRLCLEITEAALTIPKVVAVLAELRRLGIGIAIDAFGIGTTSLSTLRRLPADVVKLDRSFLPGHDSDTAGGHSYLAAVVALAHCAELKVVFEGVENQMQLNAAVLAGADAIQGFLLGPPMLSDAAMAVARQCTEEGAWQCHIREAHERRFAAAASCVSSGTQVANHGHAQAVDTDRSVDEPRRQGPAPSASFLE